MWWYWHKKIIFLDYIQHNGDISLEKSVISSSQRPLPENTQHLQQNIYAPGGI
jgi:hypothetical protein